MGVDSASDGGLGPQSPPGCQLLQVKPVSSEAFWLFNQFKQGGWTEWLGDVGISPGFLSLRDVGTLTASGDDHNKRCSEQRVGLDLATQIEPVASRHHDIEQDEVWLDGSRSFQALGSIRRIVDFPNRWIQRHGKKPSDFRVIVDDQDLLRWNHGVATSIDSVEPFRRRRTANR